MAKQDPRATFLDGLLAATAPKADTIEVEAAPGFSLTFRVITNYSEMVKMRREAAAYAASWPATAALPAFAPFAKTDLDVVQFAYYMAKTQVSEPRLMEAGFLQIAKDRANVFDAIKDAINEGQFAVANADSEAIEAAKNASSETPSGTTA